MVSDVIWPSACQFTAVRERGRRNIEGRIVRKLENFLKIDVDHFIVSYKHSLCVQIYLMLLVDGGR